MGGLETVAPRNNDSTNSKPGRTLQKPQPTSHLVSPHNTQNTSNVPSDPFKDINKMLASSDSELPRRKTTTDLLSKPHSNRTGVMGRSMTCEDPFKGLDLGPSKIGLNWKKEKNSENNVGGTNVKLEAAAAGSSAPETTDPFGAAHAPLISKLISVMTPSDTPHAPERDPFSVIDGVVSVPETIAMATQPVSTTADVDLSAADVRTRISSSTSSLDEMFSGDSRVPEGNLLPM